MTDRNRPFQIVITDEHVRSKILDVNIVVRNNCLGTSGYVSKELALVRKILEEYFRDQKVLNHARNGSDYAWYQYILRVVQKSILPERKGFELERVWTGDRKPNEDAMVSIYTRRSVPVKGRKNCYYADLCLDGMTVSINGAVEKTHLDYVDSDIPVLPYKWDTELIVLLPDLEDCISSLAGMENNCTDILYRQWRNEKQNIIYRLTENEGTVLPVMWEQDQVLMPSFKSHDIVILMGWRSYGRQAPIRATVMYRDAIGNTIGIESIATSHEAYGDADGVFDMKNHNIPEDTFSFCIMAEMENGVFDDVNLMWFSIHICNENDDTKDVCRIEANMEKGKGKSTLAAFSVTIKKDKIVINNTQFFS